MITFICYANVVTRLLSVLVRFGGCVLAADLGDEIGLWIAITLVPLIFCAPLGLLIGTYELLRDIADNTGGARQDLSASLRF